MRDGRERAAEKAAWRERFRDARRRLPDAERARASRAIAARLDALAADPGAIDPGIADSSGADPGVVSAFWPLVARGEVDLRAWIAARWHAGAAVALPVVVSTDPPRLVHRLTRHEADLVDGPWGLREPSGACPLVAPGQVALAVVPGLGMGRDGSRLGYGGGYYDAFLAATGAVRVGVVWASCLADAVPTEAWDARLDAVVTERETLRTGRHARDLA